MSTSYLFVVLLFAFSTRRQRSANSDDSGYVQWLFTNRRQGDCALQIHQKPRVFKDWSAYGVPRRSHEGGWHGHEPLPARQCDCAEHTAAARHEEGSRAEPPPRSTSERAAKTEQEEPEEPSCARSSSRSDHQWSDRWRTRVKSDNCRSDNSWSMIYARLF